MWKLGKIAGIDVSLHWSLLLLIGGYGLAAPSGAALGVVLFFSAIFGCVLLHELGHSMAARQFGINTSSIVLLPIGGIASLESMPRKPLHELWIAVAGPLVNVVIAATLFLFLELGAIQSFLPGTEGWFVNLMYANIGLVAFNLVPAFPMDGGRVLRSLLAMRIPYLKATNIAAKVGQIVAIGLGLLGLFASNLMLILVATFVYFAGSAEARMVAEEEAEASAKPTPIFASVRAFASSQPFETARIFVIKRAGETLHVIWDEQERRYRVAPSM